MARIRTIKPEFWSDERIGECSTNARLLFVATWNFADDYGGIERSAKQLKAQAFPYDVIDCEPLIQELLLAGLLVEYEASGKKYLHIKGFAAHQRVDKPGKPRVPVYEPSPKIPRLVVDNSTSARDGKESKGMESKGGEGNGVEDPPRKTSEDQPPDGLNGAAWSRWLEYRVQIRKPLKPASILAAQRKLAAFGSDQQAVVEQSIAEGYQGLFPLRPLPKKKSEWL